MFERSHILHISSGLYFNLFQQIFLIFGLLLTHGSSSFLILVVLSVYSDEISFDDAVEKTGETLGVLGQYSDSILLEKVKGGF